MLTACSILWLTVRHRFGDWYLEIKCCVRLRPHHYIQLTFTHTKTQTLPHPLRYKQLTFAATAQELPQEYLLTTGSMAVLKRRIEEGEEKTRGGGGAVAAFSHPPCEPLSVSPHHTTHTHTFTRHLADTLTHTPEHSSVRVDKEEGASFSFPRKKKYECAREGGAFMSCMSKARAHTCMCVCVRVFEGVSSSSLPCAREESEHSTRVQRK